jgi:hypothetical protein
VEVERVVLADVVYVEGDPVSDGLRDCKKWKMEAVSSVQMAVDTLMLPHTPSWKIGDTKELLWL